MYEIIYLASVAQMDIGAIDQDTAPKNLDISTHIGKSHTQQFIASVHQAPLDHSEIWLARSSRVIMLSFSMSLRATMPTTLSQ